MESDIARKIRGLLKKAEGSAFEEEADAFLRKAQELMFKHGIDEERLWATDPSRRHKIEIRKVKIPDNKPGSMQKRIMLNSIAKVNHCKMWFNQGKGESSVAGYPNDLIFVELLYTSIVTQMAFKQAMAQAHASNVHHKTFKSNFADAFASRIHERLMENHRRNQVAIQASEPGMAIAIMDRKTEVDNWVKSKYRLGSARGSSNSGTFNSQAYAAGRQAADTTDISGGRGGKLGSGRKALPSG